MTSTYDIGVHYSADEKKQPLEYMNSYIKDIGEKGGSILLIDEPEHVELAYTINGKVIGRDGVYPRHTHSYFFTLRCELPDVEQRSVLDKKLYEDVDVVRHMITKTTKDAKRIDPSLMRDEKETNKKNEQVKNKEPKPTQAETDTSNIGE